MKTNSQGAFAPVTPHNTHNGFPILTRLELTCHCHIAMDYVESMRSLFSAIKLLGKDSPEIMGLATHGKNLADLLHNDIDVVREEAEKAGIEGYIAPEVHHG
ncbi:hypothetical protein [Nitrosovibrio sp. Nv4]|uniref:hypothetical protein n=1 Tax=Nitrosovibrio sp. Nv4 TaxID=1945880 RepID=UPI000BCAA4CC|nr:hypothetical protein [Nitrosovibrio sp. Nv4]SOD40563.1 hypothetical protein SAMN06298226_0835 [Nitrosovibrio sp. Nv4]